MPETKITFIIKDDTKKEELSELLLDLPIDIEIYNENQSPKENLPIGCESTSGFSTVTGQSCSGGSVAQTGISAVDQAISTINWFGLYLLSPWLIKKILSDADDKIWIKVKSSFKNVFNFFLKKKKEDKNIGLTFWYESWHIIFIFNINLNEDVLINGFENIPIVVKNIESGKYSPYMSLIFELDPSSEQWSQINNKNHR
jgi:hypothetical protein